ncbi:hypothetical protein QVD17_17822 [Tagetes erecta]|uniref:SAM-dependent MTase DRM-type domain-containing protein n=1 Tax=Tagetes erecta TaxID=13708 RepID=A0AAD8KXE9_TARER|nr:hypothetical protein QVD17_17822 [Tagetes erecta]
MLLLRWCCFFLDWADPLTYFAEHKALLLQTREALLSLLVSINMFEITNLSDSEEEEEDVKPVPLAIKKLDTIVVTTLIISKTPLLQNNGASSSRTNIRSSLLGMGFMPDLVDKAIRQNGEDNMDLLLETLFAYSTLQTSKVRSLQSTNGSFLEKAKDLALGRGKRKAPLISQSESSDSLDDLFEDEKVISSRSTNPTTNLLKEDPDEGCDVIDDKKASLLMMNFTMEEVEFAINKLGEGAPVNELVDFIFAAQMATADDSNKSHGTKTEDANTETLFGTMDKTLRLLEIGFSEQEISAAIEKYGSEVSISELADSIVFDRMAGPCVKTEEDPFSYFGDDSWMAGNKFKPTAMGAEKVLDASFYSNLALRTEESSQAQIRTLNIVDRSKGKQPKEDEAVDEPVSLQRPKPEFEDLNSYSGSAHAVSKPPVSAKVLQRQLRYKARRMAAIGVPKLIQPASCSSVDQIVAKAPLFFYGNVMNLSHDSWIKISQFLYAIEPESVNTEFFSALICDKLRNILVRSKGRLSVEQQKDFLHQCKTLNLMWVARNRLAPMEPETVERILGYPLHHTEADGVSLGERLQSLKYSFQMDTLGYHLSVLKSMFTEGLSVLSIYSGVGGAEITLNRLGIRLKAVVSIEPSEMKRKILWRWRDKSDQTGELVQIATIQKLSSSNLESLMNKFGVFDFIICQNPYTYSPRSVTMAAEETESFAGLDFSLFYEFVRVLQRVRNAIKT